MADVLSLLRQGLEKKRKVYCRYSREDGQKSERTIRPLSLAFVAPHWMVSGWCELREAFRTFRLDRMNSVRLLDEPFEDETGITLTAFLKHVREER